MKVLLAGPWVGEFGWELFCWQAYVRKMSRRFDKTIVLGRPRNGIFYRDFANEYIEFDPESNNTEGWLCYGGKPSESLVKSIEHTHYLDGQFNIGIRYTEHGVMDLKGLFFNEQEFFKYHNDQGSHEFDIVLHGRNKKTGSDRNWEKNKWDDLADKLKDKYRVACIGTSEAFTIKNTTDLRNIPGDELVYLMNNCKLVVGPSSGPMHFASLCGTPHLVWSTEYNRVRYERDWNPFKTEVLFYGKEGFDPKVDSIFNIISTYIK